MTTTFRRILHTYLDQSQIHGYKIIVSANRTYLERLLWSCLALVGIGFTAWLIACAYAQLMVTPTVTSQRPNRVSVLDLPFPAVAFCSENRISRRAVMAYAEMILNATADSAEHIGRTPSEIAHNLLVLGKMYDLRLDDEDFYIYDRVHSVLSTVYDGAYPIADILAQLTPTCDQLLKRCKWLGRNANCSELFTVRRTYAGSCCAFNYVRPISAELRRQAESHEMRMLQETRRTVKKHGPQFGLIVMLDQQPEDYAFSLHSNVGVRILVFDPVNFPDQTSGAVQEKFLGVGEEMFLTVAPQPNQGDEDMRKYDRMARNCVFAEEIPLVYENFYTFSECLLVCRINNIRRFCGCLPPQYTSFQVNASRCLLNDIPCLMRWSANWYNSESLVSSLTVSPQSVVELDNHCPACLPLCNMVKFYVESSTSNFVQDSFEDRLLDPEFTRGLHADNHSIAYVNFGTHKVSHFDQASLSTWYEQLAFFGGLVSITFGASILSVVEIVYFGSGKFGVRFWKSYRRAGTLTSQSKDREIEELVKYCRK